MAKRAHRDDVASRLREVRRLERAARTGDVEAIHDLRVATRRLRAALGLAVEGAPRKRAVAAVRRLARALGDVRDLDAQLEWLHAALAEADDETRPGVGALVAGLEARRARAFVRVAPALDRWADEGAPRVEAAIDHSAPPSARRARRRLDRRQADVARFTRRARREQDPYTLHALRIAARKLRYTAELLESLQPRRARPILRATTALQAPLGALHDRDVLLPVVQEFLVAARRHELPGGVALLARLLDERRRLLRDVRAAVRRAAAL